MKNKKIYTILVICIIVYLLLFLFFFRKKDDDNGLNNYAAMAVFNDAFFLYQNNKWKSISKINRTEYNWLLYDVYKENRLLKPYYMIYSGVWNLFNESRERQDLSFNELMGISSDLKYKVREFSVVDNSYIDSYTNSVFKKYKIPEDVILTVNNTITIDLDYDGELEKIYTVTNTFSEIEQPVTFGFIFIVDDDKITMVYNQVDFKDTVTLDDTCRPYVYSLLDFKDRNSIIVSCSYYSDSFKKVILYYYKDQKCKEMVSN